ncbi:MAG: hypothetical protein M0017_00570 [Desulfobacteraceae bacterium]|nr:hypothetical protein [Desulfobacteraceae bacterium]
MSISELQNSTYLAQIIQSSQSSNIDQNIGDGDGGNDPSSVSSVGQRSGGGLVSAIDQALVQAGISAPVGMASGSPGTSTASDQNAQEALQAFMQNLFAALQSAGGQAAGDGSAGSGSSAVSGASVHGHHHHHGGGHGRLQASMQTLIQQLSASDSSSSNSSSTDTALQQSYQNLLSAQGASGNQTSLPSFLRSISQNLRGAGTMGNVIDTQG